MSRYATSSYGFNSTEIADPYQLLEQILTHQGIVAKGVNKALEAELLKMRDEYLSYVSSDTLELKETRDESRRMRIQMRIKDSKRQIADLDHQLSKLNRSCASSKSWLEALESRISYFSVVSIKFSGADNIEEYVIVPDEYRNISVPKGLYPVNCDAPLGKALMGNHAGENQRFVLPDGRTREFEILKVRMASETELREICINLDKQGGSSFRGCILAIDFRYNVAPIESMPQYVHGSMPARQRMGG
jgi:transcription elongation GreA/GreB family factor